MMFLEGGVDRVSKVGIVGDDCLLIDGDLIGVSMAGYLTMVEV